MRGIFDINVFFDEFVPKELTFCFTTCRVGVIYTPIFVEKSGEQKVTMTLHGESLGEEITSTVPLILRFTFL